MRLSCSLAARRRLLAARLVPVLVVALVTSGCATYSVEPFRPGNEAATATAAPVRSELRAVAFLDNYDTYEYFDYRAGSEDLVTVWMELSNRQEGPVQLQLASAVLLDDEGSAYGRVSPETAWGIVQGWHTGHAATAGGTAGLIFLVGPAVAATFGVLASIAQYERDRLSSYQALELRSQPVASGRSSAGMLFFNVPRSSHERLVAAELDVCDVATRRCTRSRVPLLGGERSEASEG
jgi:hypothetical protein